MPTWWLCAPIGCLCPALRQHPHNHGHALVLPVKHTRNLADASPSVREEIFAVAARLTSSMPPLYGAAGSIVFQNNTAPDDPLFHLHVHVVRASPTISL
jgi:histidine triad (HIT) family protein